MNKSLACLLAFASGCPDVKLDPDDSRGAPLGPMVEFAPSPTDPGRSILPFPNNLPRDPMTGIVTIPAQPCEGAAASVVRQLVLNKLDGFGTYETALQLTLTAPVDPTTLMANIVFMRRVPASATPIPFLAI